MYAIELDTDLGIDSSSLREGLQKKGVGTRPFFIGMHAQPVLRQLDLGFERDTFPVADHAYRYGCYLPSGMTLTEGHIDKVCLSLQEVLEGR
jgi:perosamine synthetase